MKRVQMFLGLVLSFVETIDNDDSLFETLIPFLTFILVLVVESDLDVFRNVCLTRLV